MMMHKTIPIFVSHMGCPNDCSFCNQRKITGQTETITAKKAEEIILNSLKTLPEGTHAQVGFFGGSFTGIDKNTQKELLSVSKKYIDKGYISSVRLSTRPDYIDADTVKMLKSYGVQTVELGAQSMDDEVLKLNRRGHTASDTKKASEIIKSEGLELGLQMMTGLYGDTDEKCQKTASEIIALLPECVRIYPTLVLKDTYLHTLLNEKKYIPQTLEKAVSLCAKLKSDFDKNGIQVIRIGLMSSDNINPENDVVAGPYHASFGELVLSEIYFRNLREVIKKDAKVLVNPKSISAFLGNKKQNITKFKDLGYKVEFVQDINIPSGEFKLL